MTPGPSLDNDATITRSRAVFARHAASLLVWRVGPAGTEVLMGVRGAGHRFVPNRLVFPGGAVDRSDRSAPAATEPTESVLAALRHRTPPRLARAIAMAAARELQEETALSLGNPPHLDQLDYLCRAVTPPAAPIRFNARFLTVPASAVHGTPADSHELHAVRFYSVAEAQSLAIMAVTRWVLACLADRLANPADPRLYPLFRREKPGYES
jgi:8-oxo-dGTP pyrophosphatase MutT (NUDIX family)